MTIHAVLAADSGSETDPRRARILEGALKVFLAYGYARTTMDDIARAAELSRPALYLAFRNKADIYRALAAAVLDECLRRTRAILSVEEPLVDRLDRLIREALVELMREIVESPHGIEILDMKNSLAGDILAEWRGQMDSALETAFAAEAKANGVDLASRGITARVVAQTFLDCMEGVKMRLTSPTDQAATAHSVARVLAAALRP